MFERYCVCKVNYLFCIFTITIAFVLNQINANVCTKTCFGQLKVPLTVSGNTADRTKQQPTKGCC